MKALDVISSFDELRPNSFDFETKKRWLMTLEGSIHSYIGLHSPLETRAEFSKEENPSLCLGEEYRDLYVYYLISMADLANGEYKLYNISGMYFNSLFDKWKREHRSRNVPQKNTAIKY